MDQQVNRRALVVSDQQPLLAVMQKSYAKPQNGWHVTCVTGIQRALEILAIETFDVILADLHLTGMNGADLLNEVMHRRPCMLRFLMTGKEDEEFVRDHAGLPHQFLTKPPTLPALPGAIQRVLELDASLTNRHLRQLISKLDRLPSVPSIYVEIVDRLQDPEVSMDEIGAVVGRDIGMTAKILKVVNSATFGLRRQISTPAEAVNYLGVEVVKSLVLTVQVFSHYEHIRQGGFPFEATWEHSMMVGTAARALIRAEDGDRAVAEEAFVGGLLHDSGKLVLAANFPEHYDEIMRLVAKQGVTMQEGEYQFFQADHADVGGYLLSSWGLPVTLVDAVAHHHRPARAKSDPLTPLGAVFLANELVQEPRPLRRQDPPSGRLGAALAVFGQVERLNDWRDAVESALPRLKAAA